MQYFTIILLKQYFSLLIISIISIILYLYNRVPNSDRQRELLNDINDLHSSMIREHEEIREYLQTETFGNSNINSNNNSNNK